MTKFLLLGAAVACTAFGPGTAQAGDKASSGYVQAAGCMHFGPVTVCGALNATKIGPSPASGAPNSKAPNGAKPGGTTNSGGAKPGGGGGKPGGGGGKK